MTAEKAQKLAQKFIVFLETGKAPTGLFSEDIFCDFTMPRWRLQAQGIEKVIALRQHGHPSPGTVPRFRVDPTPNGFVLELEERWQQDGKNWYCREMFRADVRGESICELSVYCTGDWDDEQVAKHKAAVTLLRS